MNWYKAKTILIIFFLCTNIFLLVNILNAAGKSVVIPEEVVASAVEILEKNGISIDPGIIPRRNKAAAVIHVKNAVPDQAAFAAKILNGEPQKNTDGTYTGPAGTLEFTGNAFSFTAAQPLPAGGASPGKTAASFLKALDFSLSGADRTVSGSTVDFQKRIAGCPFLDGRLTAELENGGVASVRGCWFEEDKQGVFREKVTLKSITSILVDYAGKTDSNAPITGLEFGYALPGNAAFCETAVLVPTWVITTEQSEQFFMDARENNT